MADQGAGVYVLYGGGGGAGQGLCQGLVRSAPFVEMGCVEESCSCFLGLDRSDWIRRGMGVWEFAEDGTFCVGWMSRNGLDHL